MLLEGPPKRFGSPDTVFVRGLGPLSFGPEAAKSQQHISNMMTSTAGPAATKGSRSSLPPEIWTMIFQEVRGTNCLEEMVWLWIDGRHVSRYFMSLIEEMFMVIFLPKARIRFYLG
jgi:hypothetical protein